jgi:hypothetical protein
MLVASRLLLAPPTATSDATAPPGALASCMKLLDLGIMMGGPRTQPLLHSAVAEAEHIVASEAAHTTVSATTPQEEGQPSKRQRSESVTREHSSTARSAQLPLPPQMEHALLTVVERRSLPPLEVFLQHYMKSRRPVVLTNAMRDWPAMTPISTSGSDTIAGSEPLRRGRWADMQYLKRVAGMRTVPVEVGDTYLSKSWRQEMMTFSDFISRHIEKAQFEHQSCSQSELKQPHDEQHRQQRQQHQQERVDTAYLAQHPLFDQIPRLRDDIVTPLYCYLTERSDGGDAEPAVNGWFGK